MAARMWRSVLLLALFCLTSATQTAYYTYDGRGNNVIHENWGSVGELFLRTQVPAATGYGSDGDMSFAFSKNTREISLGLTLPAYRYRQRNAQHKTDMLTYIGQFFNHDIDLREEGEDAVENRIDVEIDHCDLRFNKAKCSDENAAATAFSMIRSKGEISDGVRQQINTITAYLDGSVVYGSDAITADKLRSRYKGKMLTYNGELPKNTMGVTMANPAGNEPDAELRAAGDVRANVNPVLLAIQSLFIREHNRLADGIYQAHPDWSDEEIYQEARKWNVAYMQSICYYEYIPLLGIQLPLYTGYKSTVNPGIDNFFATVAYRYGHSEVNDVIARVDDDGKNIDDDYITLMEAYFFPSYSLSAGIEPLLRGASFTRQAEVSPHFASSLQNYLFGVPAFGGADLLAINLQRGRDHGMPSYNEARSALGLVRVTDFSDITSDVYLQKQLEEVYGDVDNVEPYVGGCAEDSYLESNFGELFYASLADQYLRIRDGDRFYFENTENSLFTQEEINEIRQTGLRDVILRNTDIETLPQNIYISNPDEPWPLKSLIAPDVAVGSTAGETLSPGVYELEWSTEAINGEDYFNFKLMCKADGWVGIGFAKGTPFDASDRVDVAALDDSSAMVGADIVIATFSDGSASVHDYWAETFAQPTLDTALGGTDDVELISGSHVGGMTTVEFRRKVSTGDSYDRDIRQTEPTPIIYAWHSTSQELTYHTPLRRGKASIDFFAPFQAVPALVGTEGTSQGATQESSAPSGGGAIIIDESKNLRFTWKTTLIDGVEWIDATMTMQVNGPAWMGVAIESSLGGLNKADFIKVTANSLGSCSIRDYWAETPTEILLDTALGGSDDTLSSFCYVSGGYLDFEFKRPLNTGDNFDWPFLKNAYTDVLFAYDDTTASVDSATMRYSSMSRSSLGHLCSEERVRVDVSSASWTQPSSVSGSETTVPTTTTPTEPAAPSSTGVTTTEPAPIDAPAAPVSTTGEITLVDSTNFVLTYELFEDEISFTLCLKGQGFGAIGIPGASLNMMDADVFAAVSDGSGGCSIKDYWSTGFVAPVEDVANGGTDDFMDATCEFDGEMITASFRRKLQTGDSNDRDIDPADIPIIYAFSESAGGLQYHGPTGRGATAIQPDLSVFQESAAATTEPASQTTVVSAASAGGYVAQDNDIGAVTSNRAVFLAHTWFIGIGFGVFAVAAALLERVGRGWASWRKALFSTQLLSILFVFIGELTSLARSEGRVSFAHCVLTYVLLFASPPQALLSTYTYRKDRWVPAWKKLNRIVDYFVYALGFFQFWTALRLLNADITAFQLFYAYTTAVTAILLFVPRSSDQTRQLPLTAVKREPAREDSVVGKSFAEKVEAKSQSHTAPSFTQRADAYAPRSSIARAESRKSEIPAYKPSPSPQNPSREPELLSMTPEEFQERVSNGKCWTVIQDKIYEMEKFQRTHPGGQENIEDIIGKDGTDLYMEAHETSDSAHRTLAKYHIGNLNLS